MSKMSPSVLLEQLEWRYAVKKFDATKKISAGDWQALEKSLVLTPSSYGLQPWKFLVIRNDSIRSKLKAVSWNQTQVTDCSHYVVFTFRESMTEKDVQRYIDSIVKVRGVDASSLDN